jgi:hypothetical protein
MKWTFIIINLLAAVGFLFLGSVASAIHHVHSYSMYREFVAIGAVDEEKVKKLPIPQNWPQTPYYDMTARMQQIGNAEAWFGRISGLAAVACVCNAGAIFFLARRPRPMPPNKSPEPTGSGASV